MGCLLAGLFACTGVCFNVSHIDINGGPQKLKMKQIPEIIITNPELTKADGTLHTGTTLDVILKGVDEAAMQTLRQRKWG